MTNLFKVALRQRAIYVPESDAHNELMTESTADFVERLHQLGYVLEEDALRAVNNCDEQMQHEMLETIREVFHADANWAPLDRGWETPSEVKWADFYISYAAGALDRCLPGVVKGTRLQCGCLIPEGVFPLERYNGCPLCGKPFKLSNAIYTGQGSQLRSLSLWRKCDAEKYLASLLESPVPLDATGQDDLKLLLAELEVRSDARIAIKENATLLVDALLGLGRLDDTFRYIKSPADVMRYFWYKSTGKTRVKNVRFIRQNLLKAYSHWSYDERYTSSLAAKAFDKWKVHFSRAEGRIAALWLNAMPASAEACCEMMHPRRAMWVRYIRALRLAEFARRKGFERLSHLLDVFYNQKYFVFGGEIERRYEQIASLQPSIDSVEHNLNRVIRSDRDREAFLRYVQSIKDANPKYDRIAVLRSEILELLKTRPGYFARVLFSTMLRNNADATVEAFRQVIPEVPLRIVTSLYSFADEYFEGIDDTLPEKVNVLCLDAYRLFFQEKARAEGILPGRRMYIDSALESIPMPVGDRADTIQDASNALQGTRFPVEGDAVRVFMQWGEGLKSQWLDMDLSCYLVGEQQKEFCNYATLSIDGAKHSGDIRQIPDYVGTAEYIELDIPVLAARGIKYVCFACNAYQSGRISPNLCLGWMNSAYPMTVSDETGVAYDPSCVQHMVRVAESDLKKGLVFGVLDVEAREIIWLELPFWGQTVWSLSMHSVEKQLKRLESKVTVAEMLQIKAEAQGYALCDNAADADEAYTMEWARNVSNVSALLK